ncbi:hypothetical protein [Streptomyces thermolineatus]
MKPSTHPGRIHVVQGWTTHPTQVLCLTDAGATVWITSTTTKKS